MRDKNMNLFLICFLSTFTSLYCLQCMNDNNEPVDWFVAYKLPEVKHHHKLLKAGVAYVYTTSKDDSKWSFSNKSINDTRSILANSLPIFNNLNNYSYILYNDQPPNKKSKSSKGHNKGVVLADMKSGLWLIHSVPHFPILGKTYIFPRTGAEFGQSFLCISLDLNILNEVGVQLQYNEPEIYAQNILSKLKIQFPELANAAANVTVKKAPWYRRTNIPSKNGTQFVSFAKSKNFAKELYEDWVAPSLGSDLYVETWPNGPGRLASNCTKKFKVNNIQTITIKEADGASFNTTHDHSKWTVSPQANWICIGDINRMEHQKVRGGGTICLNNKALAKDYDNFVTKIEPCKKVTL